MGVMLLSMADILLGDAKGGDEDLVRLITMRTSSMVEPKKMSRNRSRSRSGFYYIFPDLQGILESGFLQF